MNIPIRTRAATEIHCDVFVARGGPPRASICMGETAIRASLRIVTAISHGVSIGDLGRIGRAWQRCRVNIRDAEGAAA